MGSPPSIQWFCALLDSAADVYFRYALTPTQRFAYISPSVRVLSGRSPDDFQADPNLCVSLVAAEDRRLLRRVLRSRRPMVLTLHVIRHGTAVPVELRTVAVTRRGRVVAIEGVARLAVAPIAGRVDSHPHPEPTQARLTALMCEVHELLHRMLPSGATSGAVDAAKILRVGDL